MSNPKSKEYVASTTEDLFNDSSSDYYSYEEAAVGYADDYDLEDDEFVWVGVKEDWFPSVNVDRLLEQFGEDANDRFEDGLCGDWPNLSDDEYDAFTFWMNKAAKHWFTETDNLPAFYEIENIKSILIADARGALKQESKNDE